MAAEPKPNPECEFCASQAGCAKPPDGASRGCFRPQRRLDLVRLRDLFATLRRQTRLPPEPYQTLERRLLERLAADLPHYSGLLEFSLCARPQGQAFYRFSYGFPGFGADSAALIALCREWSALFGPEVEASARRLLELARPGLVEQLLLGLDATPGALRLKLYFQFPPGLAKEKLRLLCALLGTERLRASPLPYARLHLIGFDLGASGGLGGLKLYVGHEEASAAWLRQTYPHCGFVQEALATRCPTGLRDLLEIYRLDAGSAPPLVVSELDFSLRANGLSLAEVERYYRPHAAQNDALALLRRLTQGTRIAATRLSVEAAGTEKMNLYYVPLD